MKAELIISSTNPEYDSITANVYFQNAIKGEKGDNGEKGDKGDRGEKGDKGDVYFATFSLDHNSGCLNMNAYDNYEGPNFSIVGAVLQVEV